MYRATYPISSGNPVDGWWLKKTSGSGNMIWSGYLSSNVFLGVNVAQLSFTCYLSSTPTTINDVPYISIGTPGNVYSFAVSGLSWFTGAGEYTFIANLDGSSFGVSYFGDKKVSLVYNQSLSLESGSVASFNYSNYSAVSINLIQLRTTSSSVNLDFVAENMEIEIISGGSPVIESGTYQFLFTSAVVNQKYLHNATNYLYSYFFQQPMLSIVAYNS